MNQIKTILVDDEPLARKKLASFIERSPELKLVETFTNGQDALEYLRKDAECLAFLDIQMDGLSGMQLLESLIRRPKVIITSAFDEYAIKGFEYNVSDYLLKPFSFDRFRKAVEKVVREMKMEQLEIKSEASYIMIKSEYRQERIETDSILFIEGMKDYLRIHTDTRKLMTLRSFASLEKELPEDQFLRVHKSYMVALSRITAIEKDAVMIGQIHIPIGRSYKERLINTLKNRGISEC